MITFGFNESEPLSWLTGVALLLLAAVQFWLIRRNRSLTSGRKQLRGALNLLLWLVLSAYVLQPTWKTPSRSSHALVSATDVPSSYVRWLRDSLGQSEIISVDKLADRRFLNRFDSVTLVGQAFDPHFLSRLSHQTLRWIPYFESDQLQTIEWKGILRQGEFQRVSGSLNASKDQLLTIRYGDIPLDSTHLKKGFNTFELRFPAFSRGRTQTELVMGDAVLDTIRFFSRPDERLTFRFILDSPDFETKTLADWLGKNGHSVQLTSNLSKTISSRIRINNPISANPDIIVTDPAHAADPQVRKAISAGKSVLFLNLSSPETDAVAINRALGTSWKLRRLSNESALPVGKNLTAFPYGFSDALNQTKLPGYPVGIRKSGGKIGLSLLHETFSLRLSGDSLAYDRIWSAVLAQLRPSSKNNVELSAPLFKGLRETIRFNNRSPASGTVRIESDTVRAEYSVFNPLSGWIEYRFTGAGWRPLPDSLEVYVEDSLRVAGQAGSSRLLAEHVRASSDFRNQKKPTEMWAETQVPSWLWLVLLLTCFTALWLEPKLD